MENTSDLFANCAVCGCYTHTDNLTNVNGSEFHGGRDVFESYYVCEGCTPDFMSERDDHVATCLSCTAFVDLQAAFRNCNDEAICNVCVEVVE